MTKKEIVKYVANATDNTVKETELVVDTFIDYIKQSLVQHEDVTIHGLGKFTTPLRGARTARNPRTGEAVEVPPRYTVTFKPAKELKDSVNE